jgi:hypothetical protein
VGGSIAPSGAMSTCAWHELRCLPKTQKMVSSSRDRTPPPCRLVGREGIQLYWYLGQVPGDYKVTHIQVPWMDQYLQPSVGILPPCAAPDIDSRCCGQVPLEETIKVPVMSSAL